MVSVTNKQSEQDPEDLFVYVLTCNGLQKWLLGVGEPDKLYYEFGVASLYCTGSGGGRVTCLAEGLAGGPVHVCW